MKVTMHYWVTALIVMNWASHYDCQDDVNDSVNSGKLFNQCDNILRLLLLTPGGNFDAWCSNHKMLGLSNSTKGCRNDCS